MSSHVDARAGASSVAAELAWLLDLLTQTAHYAEPALDELDRSLLPGIAALREPIKDRVASLWNDSTAGCPELLAVADAAGCIADDDPRRLLVWLSTLPRTAPPHAARGAVRRRMARLASEIRLRRAYRDILAEVWDLAGPLWKRRGRAAVAAAAGEWTQRLAGATTPSKVVKLMPPRHPLTRVSQATAAAMLRGRRLAVVPIYFCMSGGQLADLGDRVHIGVPASALEPVRRTRDAMFVASRLRVLAEPTRVHILIHLTSAAAGVMEITRALRISQPAVSTHVRMLARAGLIRPLRRRGRLVYTASPRGVERLLDDATATLARWARARTTSRER